ncbi:MAG: MFS transporter, partial [Gammaproteobacteria bacterium]|nr:MFS transporter [Gammaproteobacteria bacterium]
NTRAAPRGLKLLLIVIPIFIGALDLTVVSAVLPHVILDLEIPLQSGLDDAAWIVTGYLLAYSISMTFMGRLSDLVGRRRVYLIALAVFALGSYLVAVGEGWPTQFALRIYYMVSSGRPDVSYVTLYILIASRMIQAFGAGTMVPVGMAVVGDMYPEGQRARPLGLIAAVDTAGWVVGHLYGGIIVRFWNWHTIFWLNLPICFVSFLLIWWLLRRDKEDLGEGSMDWLGALLITAGLSFLNIALGTGEESDLTSTLDQASDTSQSLFPLLILGIGFLGLFVWRQAKARYPLIKLSLFKKPGYFPANLANFLIGVGLFIAIANVPLFINSLVAETVEQGAWDSGWMLSALTVPMALAAVPGGWLTEKFGYRIPAIVGLVVAAAGFGLMSQWLATTTYLQMIPQLMLTGVGFGLTLAPVAAAVVNSSPSEYRGTSSALVIIFRLIGMTVGVSGITNYGLRRADFLSKSLLPNSATMAEIIQTGIRVMETVISETFLIAGIFTIIALIPAYFIRTGTTKEMKE